MTETIAVLGAGAFGTALAVVQAAAGRRVVLWGRDAAAMTAMARTREGAHLPGVTLPPEVGPTADATRVAGADVILLAVPTQALRGLLLARAEVLAGPGMLVSCCKGVERGTGLLPTGVIGAVLPGARTAVLTGPSFAADIARGKPTALTLATEDAGDEVLQAALSTPSLRLYLSDDPTGAQLGGALKNVVAIAAGIAIGADLGESARAALMTRGLAEMVRHATARGARAETLFGLSGFGDLVLTCTSAQSRNFRHGLALGAGRAAETGVTVEGIMTAHAVAEAAPPGEMPLTEAVSAVLKGDLTLPEAVAALLARPLRREL